MCHYVPSLPQSTELVLGLGKFLGCGDPPPPHTFTFGIRGGESPHSVSQQQPGGRVHQGELSSHFRQARLDFGRTLSFLVMSTELLHALEEQRNQLIESIGEQTLPFQNVSLACGLLQAENNQGPKNSGRNIGPLMALKK